MGTRNFREQSSKFELVINAQTATMLDLTAAAKIASGTRPLLPSPSALLRPTRLRPADKPPV
jgi:hypothetical protein